MLTYLNSSRVGFFPASFFGFLSQKINKAVPGLERLHEEK